MSSFISLLRGINVSGQKKIIMTDLKVLYEKLGFENVQTYIQSGNVVFEYKEATKDQLQAMIFEAIKEAYGFDVPNLVLSVSEIEETLNNNPFKEIDKMYFTFLSELPTQEHIDVLNAVSYKNEFFELKEKVLYSHYPNGAGKAKMNNNFIEKKLKVSATTRNLRTTKKLLEMVKQ